MLVIGKSTLLRALAHYKLDGLTHLRIMLVDQHVEGDMNTPLEWVLNADIERTALLKEEELLSSHLDGTAAEPLPDYLKDVNLELALQECLQRMDMIGVSSAEMRAKKILFGLGFDDLMMTKPTIKLSGGWAMRAALAAAVFVKPNLLLLDEPTNHLDLHALVWLELWLTTYYHGIAVIVSHDRFFLNSVCSDILEFRSTLAGQKKNSLDHYVMDYTSFEHELEERKLVQARARVAYEKGS
jgi:ATP-binding cassette, subfamily F, member 3